MEIKELPEEKIWICGAEPDGGRVKKVWEGQQRDKTAEGTMTKDTALRDYQTRCKVEDKTLSVKQQAF